MEPKPVHPIKHIRTPHHEDPIYWADMRKEEEDEDASPLKNDGDYTSLAEAFGCE